MRFITVGVLANCVVLWINASIASAQSCPAYVPSPAPTYSSEKAEMFAARYVPNDPTNTQNLVCQVPNNGWLRKNNQADNANTPPVTDNDYYRIHLAAQSSGGCMPQYFNIWSGCRQLPEVYQYRYIGGSTVEQTSPSYSYLGAVQPNNFYNIQLLDTRNQTGTASPGHNVSLLNEGSYLFESNTPFQTTSCGFSPTEREASFTANVLECKPEWYVNAGDTMNYHAPTGDITIAVPSGLSSSAVVAAINAAKADWEAALNRTINVNLNTLCTSTDERCIELRDDYGTLSGDNALWCGEFRGTVPDANGAWYDGNSVIRFRSSSLNAQNTHPDYLRRTMAHELGHYFGLYDRNHASCDNTMSVMALGGGCGNSSAPASGYKLGPTASDISPLAISTYGNQIRAICGW
jgi:hypothetical protein